jgi:hypothetical protein
MIESYQAGKSVKMWICVKTIASKAFQLFVIHINRLQINDLI